MNKYHAKPTNGYASKKEAKRAYELRMMERAGLISNLREQVEFELLPKQDGERAVNYIADFTYFDKDDRLHVEDVKGVRTPVYILKRKLMLFIHNIKIEEV